MKRGLKLFFVVLLAGVMGFLIHTALSVEAKESNNVGSSSPLFHASLENSLSDLSSLQINLNADVFSPQASSNEAMSSNTDSEKVIKLAQHVKRGYLRYPRRGIATRVATCEQGGATCRGSSTCAGTATCLGRLTCGAATCGIGTATCRGTSTCSGSATCGYTCRLLPHCQEVSPSY